MGMEHRSPPALFYPERAPSLPKAIRPPWRRGWFASADHQPPLQSKPDEHNELLPVSARNKNQTPHATFDRASGEDAPATQEFRTKHAETAHSKGARPSSESSKGAPSLHIDSQSCTATAALEPHHGLSYTHTQWGVGQGNTPINSNVRECMFYFCTPKASCPRSMKKHRKIKENHKDH